jgi:PAS domain S-box-containing protein
MNSFFWLAAGGGNSPLEALWENGDLVYCRAKRDDTDGIPREFFAVLCLAKHPPPGAINRLSHEYGLKDSLDPAWAARPVDLIGEGGGTILLLQYQDGVPLEELMGRPMEIGTFLRLATVLATALGGLHDHGLIHKDIKPLNVLVSADGGKVWLTGFGIASRLPRERQAPLPPETIAGTLAYMAPEQTGRMNRSIDTRSDLYALGVTLYQMLTGSLPFVAADPMDWVHCHIARAAVAPDLRVEHVPVPVSAIVMKLLAKTAEDRYQTAAGLERDLRRCVLQFDDTGSIEDFVLGAQDAPDRLMIPEKLYGRTSEIAGLLASFDRVVRGGRPELVLVSGYSGIGKSSVVNELHKVLIAPRGLFAAGKFDQYKRDIPYATLAQAFQSLVRQILIKSQEEFLYWRNSICEALGPHGILITDLVPELQLIAGLQSPVPALSPQDAHHRFRTVLRRFIGVFARPEHPLALFLDDLQWLDAATLELLEDLLTQQDFRHLLLIGAYRDNEVDDAHPLMRKLDAIRRAGTVVHDIVLAPLSFDDLGQLIEDSLHCEPQRAHPLVQLIEEKTGGNPFFSIQFLYALEDESLLVFDRASSRSIWDLGRINAKRYSDNVVDLMVAKLARLPVRTQAALRQLACVGSAADMTLLGTMCQTSPDELHGDLWEAVKSGLVLRLEHSYAFEHDRIQEAAYSLIPENARAETHARIGRLLLAATPPDKREEIVFELVSQFNRSLQLITSQDERAQLAQLNLIAGKRAKNAAAFSSALTYFTAGRAMLQEDPWAAHYRLTFDLEFHQAECGFMNGDFESAQEQLLELASHAETLADQATVTCLRMDLYVVLSRPGHAVDVCLDYLQQVGLVSSLHPTDEEVQWEYRQLWQRLGSREIEELIDLPLMDDAGRRVTMDVLTKLIPSAMLTDQKLHRLLIAKMVNLSLDHGNSDASCCGYLWLGLVLAADFDNYAAALRFGQLGLDLVEERGLDAFKARAYIIFAVFISPWAVRVRSNRAFLEQAFDEANRVGDLTCAGHYWPNIVTNFIACGEALGEVENQIEQGIEFTRRMGNNNSFNIVAAQLCLTRPLRGLPPHFRSFDDAKLDEDELRQQLEADPNLVISAYWYWIRTLQASVFLEDHATALQAAAKAKSLFWTSPGTFRQAEYHFYAALAKAALGGAADALRPDRAAADQEEITAHHRQLQIWALHCPENFEDRAALVGAEQARLEARHVDAEHLYEQAIRAARANGLVHHEALACERAARFYAGRGFEDIAEMYLLKARDGYLRWGADAKVRQLDARHPWLASFNGRGATRSKKPQDQQLDVAAVAKASQALSSEMFLPRLIERLMTIALQNAGADRGLLILPRQTGYGIEAEARTDGEGVVLHLGSSADHAAPEAIIRYVMRTHESVILDDATKLNLFSEDSYFSLRQPRSILCLPLIRQGVMSGIIYLENALASHVFTPDRTTLLDLLASQAAISLENTRLYADLQEREVRVRRLVESNIIGIAIWHADGRILDINDAFLKLIGHDREDVVSGRIRWTDFVPAEWRQHDLQALQDIRAAGTAEAHEREYIHKNGHRVPVLTGGAIFEATPDEGVGFVMDLTGLKGAENAARESMRRYHDVLMQLSDANRVASIGQLSASVVHEINQPLAGIAINTSLCLRLLCGDVPNVAGAIEAVRRTIRDADRASTVIKRLRTLYAKEPSAVELVDLNVTAREVMALSQAEFLSVRVSSTVELAYDLPLVMGDAVQLRQVVMNLVRNALDATKDVEGRPRRLVVRTMRDDDDRARLSVEDTGMGLDPLQVEQVFEAFFTTKVDGMGIGLSVSRAIIENHGGRLWAAPNGGNERHGGNGATFLFSIPGADTRA